MGGFTKLFKFEYKPIGFSWMIFADRDDFDRAHYNFKYVHREFLGDVRCIVFDVTPKRDAGKGRFLGRIWVEDQDFNVVRLNGTYAPRPRNAQFFHMDSWRLNLFQVIGSPPISTAKKAISLHASMTKWHSRRRPGSGATI